MTYSVGLEAFRSDFSKTIKIFRTMKTQTLEERDTVKLFEYATRNLIKEFCHKQNLQFEFENSDIEAGVVCLSDYFFNIEDIYYDMKHNKHKGKILQWYDYALMHNTKINYNSYCMGMREELKTQNK